MKLSSRTLLCFALSAFVSVMGASGAAVGAAHAGRPVIGPLADRFRAVTFLQTRRFGVVHSSQAGAWVIRDLGLPPQIHGLPAGSLSPTPYAINQRGDVALTVQCTGSACGNVAPPGTNDAYVYDSRCARWVELAELPRQLNPPAFDAYVPHGLNDRGQVVGTVFRSVGSGYVSWPVEWTRRGFAGSTVARLDVTPGDQGAAYGINNFGIAVGSLSFVAGKQTEVAVRFGRGLPAKLDANPNDAYSDAYAINDAGIAVGEIYGGAAAVFPGGNAVAIPNQCPPEFDVCDENLAVAINAGGEVLGDYVTNYFDHAHGAYVGFLGSIFGLSPLAPSCFDSECPVPYGPFTSSYVLAFNDNDDFVGYFDGLPWVSFSPVGDANGLLPATSGWQIVNVVAINNRRQIAGLGYHSGFGKALRAFVLEPAK